MLQKLRRKHVTLAIAGAFVIVCSLLYCWNVVAAERLRIGKIKFATREYMWRVTLIAMETEKYMEHAGAPPLESGKLVAWLMTHTPIGSTAIRGRELGIVDVINQRLVDPWGNDIFVISIEGRVWALGSGGPNGVWDGGCGDDIVVRFDDLK